MSSGATVAVIIVNFNAGGQLDTCLGHLAKQTRMPDKVVVVDNASTDGSVEGIESRYPFAEVLRLDRNTGFAEGNNLGVQHAGECDWIALLNPDAYADPDWLEELLKAAEVQPEYSFFGCRMLRESQPEVLDGTGDIYHIGGLAWRRDHGCLVTQGQSVPDEIFAPCAAAALYRRDVFLSVGGFDESFFCYFEDVDLGFRLRLKGHRSLYVPKATVRHVGWGTTEKNSAFSVYHGHRNMVWAWYKNIPDELFYACLPHFILSNLTSIAWFIMKGQADAIIKAKWDAFMGLPRISKARKRIQSEKSVSQKALVDVLNKEFSAPYRSKLKQ